MKCALLENINARMHDGACPTAGSLGECPALVEVVERLTFLGPRVVVSAALCIWDAGFNDAEMVANWFKEEGALSVWVTHVLHDDFNQTHAGFNIDGTRDWLVDAHFPVGHPAVAEIVEGQSPDQVQGGTA